MKNLTLLFCVAAFTATNVSATNYSVGPGQPYLNIRDVPTHNLLAGDTVKVYYKSAPYYEKFLLAGVGTLTNPIVLIGIPDAFGNKPVIDGLNAISSTQYNFYNEDRQLIKVGEGTYSDNIIIDGFVFRNANNNNTYTNNAGTALQPYSANACAVRPEMCSYITVRNCEIYDCGNGLQGGAGNPQVFTIEKSYIHDNGLSTNLSSPFQHNVYAGGGAGGMLIVQYCRFGNVQCDGQNIKSRSDKNIIRFNWIEGGKNGQIDLVDDVGLTQSSYVYGNVIIKPATTSNGRMIHWGQDQGDNPSGTLYFYNNTCIHLHNSGRFFDLTAPKRRLVMDNNICYASASQALWSGKKRISGSNNWLSTGITSTNQLTASIIGSDPLFADMPNQDFHLSSGSPCIDIVSGFVEPDGNLLNKEYVKHLSYTSRTVIGGLLDLGAYEYTGGALSAKAGNFKVQIINNKLESHKATKATISGNQLLVFDLPESFNNKRGSIRIFNTDGKLLYNQSYNFPSSSSVYLNNLKLPVTQSILIVSLQCNNEKINIKTISRR